MKKYLPAAAALAIVIAGIWYFGVRDESLSPEASKGQTGTVGESGDAGSGPGKEAGGADGAGLDESNLNLPAGDEIPETKPATQLYKSAEDALRAVRAGAKEYDDLVLEQFTNIGEDCSWCASFYASVKDLVLAPDTSKEERAYLAEVLSSSGRLENIQALVEGIKNSTDQNVIDTLAAGLELTYSKNRDDIVNYLGSQLSSNNDRLKEASVAAITNQGSELAAKTLYDHTVETGDPNGYYSLGIGLGEFVPDENTMPYLMDIASKRTPYSHLAVKALINGGLPGLRRVFDILKSSPDADFDRKMLEGASEHVSFEDGVEEYVRKEVDGAANPTIKEFGESILKELAGAQNEAAGGQPSDAAPPMSMAPTN